MKANQRYRFLSIWGFIVALCFAAIAFADDAPDSEFDAQGTDGSDFSRPFVSQMDNSGAAKHQIPINIPPGRAGVQPKLVLQYNSYKSNGWIGTGWQIPFSNIQRSTRHGVDYASFEFQIDGQELVPVDIDSQGNGEYRAKIEGQFARFFYNRGTGWVMISKNGVKSYFGESHASRQSDPDDVNRVFKWCLNKVVDTNLNYLTNEYEKDLGQIYLKRIDYTGNTGESLPPKNSIRFHLENDRSDQSESFAPHFGVATAKRLKVIEVRALGNLVCAYELKYGEDLATKQSLLASVQQYGSDSSVNTNGDIIPGSTMPQSKFTWGNGENRFTEPGPRLKAFCYDTGWGHQPRMMADVDGDGKADIVGFGAHGVRVSFFASDRFEDPQPIFKHYGDGWHSDRHPRMMADVDGDGKADIVGFGNKGVSVSFSLGRSFTDPKLLINQFGYNNDVSGWRVYKNPRMMADVNGDGKADVVGFGNKGVFVSFSLGRSFTDPQRLIDKFGYDTDHKWRVDETPRMMADVNGDGKADVVGFGADGVRVSFSAGDHFEDPRLLVDGYGFGNGLGPYNWYVEFHPRMMADVNGDGMADVVGFGYDGVYVSLSTGSGFTPLPKEPWVSNFGYDAGSWHGHPRYMADLNGDGKSDIVGFGDDGVTVSLSTGNGFIAPEIWINKYGYNDCKCNVYKNPRMIADVDGDGLSDVIGIGDKGVRVSKNLSARGHLIEKVETPSGARLEIEYANSSEYDSNPTYRRPPFIVHPVQKLKVDDGNGIIAETLFNYDGGYYDFRSREFRGFGKVGETKPNGTTTTNFYHSGDYNKDKIYRTDVRETAAEDSNFIRQTLYDWEVRDEGNTSFFVYLLNKTDELFDNGQNIASSIEDFTGYDAVGNILETEVQYWDKNSTFERITKKYAYNNQGSDSEPMWRTTMESLEGDVSGLVRQTYYRYTNDGRANLEERELVDNEGGNPVFKYQYDGCGNVTSETDARGNATETTYDTQTLTYPFTITYPQANGVKHIEINETYDYNVGKPTAVKDRNNQYTYIKYDVFGRIEQTDTPDGGQTVYIYDDHSFPRSMTERVKAQEESYIDTVTYFDGLDRKIQTASYGDAQKSIITQWQYDTMGRQEMVVGPFFGDGTLNYPQTPPIEHYFEHSTYDLRNRPLQIESPDGQNGSVLTEYSHDGLSTRTIDPDGYSKTETKDCLGRIIRVAEHSTETPDSTTKYEYNPADELVRLENTLGHVSTIAYDTLGRKISMTDPDMGHWRYAYDPNGNLKTQTDAESETTTFEYDELNRVTSKTYSSGAPSVKYVYDDPQVDNGIGRLTSVSNAAAAIEYLAYDPTGRIVEERKTISGEGAFTTRKTYDLAGKLIQHTFPGDNYAVEYHHYPGSNLLEKVIGAGDSHEYVYCSDYLPNGKMGTLVYGNGARTRYTYDPLSLRLTDINTSHNSNTLLGRSYQYKPSGDIWEITDGVNHITYTYTYDERHRLISETSSEPSPGFTPAVIELRYDDPEHIHAVSDVIVSGVEKSYSYDSNGNMTVGPDLTDPADPTDRAIYYNADNMPDEIRNSDGEITRFAYDGDNQRVTKQSPGGKKTLYIDDNYEVIDGVAHKYIFAGNLRVAMIKGSETYYFHKDHLGSSSVMTRQDGSILESGLYLPYGNQRGTDDIAVTGYKFTDQEHDGSTGLYNYGTRLYDPVIGRFISADNLVPDHFNPQALNRYAYVLNNPLKYVDPTGETEAETGMEYDIFETQYLKTDFWFLDISVMPLFNEANNLSAYFLNVFVNGICYLHDAEEWIITEALGGDPIDVEAFDAYMLFNGAALYEFSQNARLVRNIAPKSLAGLSRSHAKTALKTAQEAYKGTTRVGHALSKHAGRNPDIWGKITGSQKTWNNQAMKHMRDIFRGPGEFQRITNNRGITFLEKSLGDGRGIRLNQDYTFKGFID